MTGRALTDGVLSLLPKPIREPRRPLLAIGVGWGTAFLPSIALAALITVLLPDASHPQFPFRGADLFFRVVILAPILETLIMGVVLLILLQFLRSGWAVLVTAVIAALAHSFSPNGVAVWGLVIWWPFLIFSTLFVVWLERSLLAAFAMAALVHALHNLPTAALLAAEIGP